jgi:hypothetical protein
MLGSADYTASNGTTVVLAAGATAGDLVETISFFVSSVLNALPQSGGSLSGNLSFAGTAGISGNLPFVGTGNRITGDFSNATQASRVLFQNSVTNALTSVGAIPNGTANTARFQMFSSSDPSNSGVFTIGLESNAEGRLNVGATGTGTNLPMTFYTGGSERMRIDTNGYITASYQPAFAASGVNSNVSTAAGNPLQFSVLDLNRGSNFNTSTYRFTAPVAGVYYFSVTAHTNSSAAQVVFRKNGTEIYGAGDPSPMLTLPTASTAASISTLLSLNANDYVDTAIRVGASTVNIYMGHSEFVGYLIG